MSFSHHLIHWLVGHFRAAVGRVRDVCSMIPLSAVAAYDVKVNNLCKIIDPKAESDPLLVYSFIWKAVRMSGSVSTTTADQSLAIPCSFQGHIETLSLDVSGNQYYMEEIARKLDARDASHLLVSRTVGKASSEMKLYFSVPEAALVLSDSSADLCSNIDGNAILEPLLNKRASYLSGQATYGDVILANVGYTWKSPDLFYEDVSLCTYYRMLLGKVPDGQAILAAELPTAFTACSNWKGPFPRDLLCVFCCQHRLLEPLFSVKTIDPSETLKSEACKKN